MKKTRRKTRSKRNGESANNSIADSVASTPKASKTDTTAPKKTPVTESTKAESPKTTSLEISNVPTAEQPSKTVSKKQDAEKPLLSLKSPVKRPSQLQPSVSPRKPSTTIKSDLLDAKKAEAVIHKAFTAKDLPKLTSVLNDLKTTRADQIFNEFKASAEIRFKTSDDLISSLTSRNKQLQQEVTLLKERLDQLESGTTQGLNEEAQYENELILDMIEQIVGLRLHRVEETDDALSFDCSQSGKNGSEYYLNHLYLWINTDNIFQVLDYKLTISKEDSSDLIYTPMNSENESSKLSKFLPEYFFDNLTFPLDTLQQFYQKIHRGLNK